MQTYTEDEAAIRETVTKYYTALQNGAIAASLQQLSVLDRLQFAADEVSLLDTELGRLTDFAITKINLTGGSVINAKTHAVFVWNATVLIQLTFTKDNDEPRTIDNRLRMRKEDGNWRIWFGSFGD